MDGMDTPIYLWDEIKSGVSLTCNKDTSFLFIGKKLYTNAKIVS